MKCSCYTFKKKEVTFATLFWGSPQDQWLKLVVNPVKMKVRLQHLICALRTWQSATRMPKDEWASGVFAQHPFPSITCLVLGGCTPPIRCRVRGFPPMCLPSPGPCDAWWLGVQMKQAWPSLVPLHTFRVRSCHLGSHLCPGIPTIWGAALFSDTCLFAPVHQSPSYCLKLTNHLPWVRGRRGSPAGVSLTVSTPPPPQAKRYLDKPLHPLLELEMSKETAKSEGPCTLAKKYSVHLKPFCSACSGWYLPSPRVLHVASFHSKTSCLGLIFIAHGHHRLSCLYMSDFVESSFSIRSHSWNMEYRRERRGKLFTMWAQRRNRRPHAAVWKLHWGSDERKLVADSGPSC